MSAMTQSYVGTHPTGRRYYVQSKTGRPLAFAVFVRDVRLPTVKWQRVALVEDRPYKDERHRVDGCYVPYPGDMPPHVKAEESARWYREVIGNHEAVVVELRPAGTFASKEDATSTEDEGAPVPCRQAPRAPARHARRPEAAPARLHDVRRGRPRPQEPSVTKEGRA